MKKKCAQIDYTEGYAPHNRKQVFFDCYKVRFLLLFELGLLSLLFLLPLLILCLSEDSNLAVLYSMAETDKELCAAIRRLYSLVKIPGFAVFGVGVAGIIRLLRQLIWGEGIFFWEDFLLGVKQNGKVYTLFFLFLGFANSGNVILSTMGFGIPEYVFLAVCLLLVLPVSIWMLLQTCVYDMKFVEKFRNALRFYILTFPKTLVLLILTLALLSLSLIQVPLIKYIAILIAVLFLEIPLCMLWLLFACSAFDKYINEKAYPELMNRGMAVQKEESPKSEPSEAEES